MDKGVTISTGQGKLTYMNFFRGFTIIMIVMVHCTTRYLDKEHFMYPYIYDFFAHSTNIFLFISGFLFEYLLYKEYPYSVYIHKKIKRLIVPYLFWSVPIVVAFMLTVHQSDWLRYFVWTMWTGLDHFNDAHWYIPFIFMIFVISPLFVCLQKRGVLYPFIMPVFIFVMLISSRARLGWFYGMLNIFPLLGMFFFGMFVSHYRNTILKWYKFDYILIIVGLLICFLRRYYELDTAPHFEEAMAGLRHGLISVNYRALNKLFLSVGFLLLFYRISLRYNEVPFLDKLANYSFAVYFVHLYVANTLSYALSLTGNKEGGVIWLIIMSAIVLGVSYGIISLLRQFKITKNIIGV